ncbi:MAG: hypothetical protein AAF934_02840, partial [Bacteroidota bacterium]
MKRTTYIKLLISLSSIIAGIWYFVVKDYNYKITFTNTQAPGIIYANLLQWDGQGDHIQAITTLSKNPFSKIQQQLTLTDSIFTYRWIIERKNDTTTKVTAYIKDRKNSFIQNLQVPFYKNTFVRRNIATVENIAKQLLQNKNYYNVSSVQKDSTPATHCAYITLSSTLKDKASTMMKNINTIMNYIRKNNITITGDPFLEITNWNIHENTITFNFCFPIAEKETYPETNTIKFKKTTAKNALKTTFNGNYRISDNAWYTIIDYAQTHNIAIEHLPFEIY